METIAMNVKGFTVIPVKASASTDRVQSVYLKKLEPRHRDLDLSKPPQRTVFVGNTPPWATENDLKQGFQWCGKVESVFLQPAPTRGKEETEEAPTSCKKWHRVAYIVFKTAESAEKAIKRPYDNPIVLASQGKCQSGVARYKALYTAASLFEVDTVKKELTENIEKFNKKEEEKEEAAKNNEPDEEGWVTVTRIGKNKGAPRTEAEDSRVKTKMNRKRKQKEYSNFYAFQSRENKKKRIEQLQQLFQKDLSVIEKMKKDRKFRPF